MTDDKRMDEILELASKFSRVAEGHTKVAVLYALINSLAIGIANTSHSEAELEKASEEVTTALRAAARGYWAAK